MQRKNGNKWSDIAKNLPGRTENQVKNRFKSIQSKKKFEKQDDNKDELAINEYINSMSNPHDNSGPVNDNHVTSFMMNQNINHQYNINQFFDCNFYPDDALNIPMSGSFTRSETDNSLNYRSDSYKTDVGNNLELPIPSRLDDYPLSTFASFASDLNFQMSNPNNELFMNFNLGNEHALSVNGYSENDFDKYRHSFMNIGDCDGLGQSKDSSTLAAELEYKRLLSNQPISNEKGQLGFNKVTVQNDNLGFPTFGDFSIRSNSCLDDKNMFIGDILQSFTDLTSFMNSPNKFDTVEPNTK